MAELLKNRNFTNQFFLLCVFYIISSCTQNTAKQQIIGQKKDTLKPPVMIAVKNPVVINLDTCPPPHFFLVPSKPGGSHIVQTDGGILVNKALLPPRTIETDFFLQMQNYNTEQGLAFSSVLSSYCDKKGNLWFGTNGNGISRYDGKSFTNYTNIPVLFNTAILY